MLVIGFDECRLQAQGLANALTTDYQEVSRHAFPDGESLIKVPIELPAHVVLVRSLNQPNSKIIELLFSTSALRKHGAKRITLVAPYLCYMRQDTENYPGEAVSQQVIGSYWLIILTTSSRSTRIYIAFRNFSKPSLFKMLSQFLRVTPLDSF